MRVCASCKELAPAGVKSCLLCGAGTDEVSELPAGAKVAGYKIVRILGEGGMGFVYEAEHEVLRRRTAMKFLRPEFASEPEVVQRFMQEAKAVNLIDHDHIVNIYDIGDAADGSVYFVMELLEGKELAELQQAGRPLALPLLVHIYGQILRALGAAHAKQIVHRDLKPANVFIIKRGDDPFFVKLLDFGVAKLRTASKVMTQAGTIMGTPNYMSPEQVQGLEVDARSDLFTLGIMMYRAATGVAPFTGESFGELAGKILGFDPHPVREVAPEAGIPASLERLIHKALKKAPAERYQSVAEMLVDLEVVRREAKLDDATLRAVLGELAGRAPDETPGPRPGAPVTRASLAASNPVFQGVPAERVAEVEAKKRTPMAVYAVGGVAVVAVVLLLVLRGGGGGAGSAAKPSAGGTTIAADAAAAGPVLADVAKTPGFAALAAAGDWAAVRARASTELRAELDGDAAAQGQAVAALGLAGGAASAPLLYIGLGGGPDTRVRAARALAAIGLPDAAPKVRAALEGSGDRVRVELAASLIALGDPDAIALLEPGLGDPSTALAAAVALAKAGKGDAARKVLTEVLAGTPAGRERWRTAALALARLGDKPARAALAAELSQADPARVVAAAEALLELEDLTARGVLVRMVADPAAPARAAAALALARRGEKVALDFVTAGLASASADDRATAVAVAARFFGQGGDAHRAAACALADDDPDPRVRAVARAALLGA